MERRIVGLLLTIGLTLARSLAACEPERPQISLFVFNYADAPDDALKRARIEVTRIFRGSEVYSVWTDRLSSSAPGVDYSANQLCAYSVHVIVRTHVRPEHVRFPKLELGTVFGESALRHDRGMAFVSFDDILSMARARRQNVGAVLGYVIAHEIGHLLLPAPAHSAIGIMRPDWSVDDLRQIERGFMAFTRLQSTLIRARVSAMTPDVKSSELLP